MVEAIPPSERGVHFARLKHLFGQSVQERRDLPNGYAFRFLPETFEELALFVSLERRCCPFLSFELSLAADAGALWLRMTGPDGVRGLLAEELNAASA
jgi:hypothetical protein